MLGKVIIENGQKKIQALTADTGIGAPVGSYLYLEKKSNPQGYLYCDGSTFDETVYPALYQYLGTNVLPDWREFSAVGAEQNTTSSVIATHDVFTQGEEKDDCLQKITGNITVNANSNDGSYITGASGAFGTDEPYSATSDFDNAWSNPSYGKITLDSSRVTRNDPNANVTRGKSKAVFIYIKATSGLTENQQENVLNTINENNSYSTEEHPTGAKWIDGKPIYRKTFNYGTVSSNSFSVTTNVNLETLVNYGGSLKVSDIIRPFPFLDPTSNMKFAISSIRVNEIEFYNAWGSATDFVFYIEYTKTTD